MQQAGSKSVVQAGGAGGAGDVLVCTQLTRTFKDFWQRDAARAVNNLSFSVGRNEVFGLLGPNGSGKSTTIKMILGLLRPTSGRVALFGKAPTDVAVKKRVGYLPEESYMYGFLNGRETLQYYAKLFELDYRTRERRIDELLDMLGIAHAQHRPVREYSKGMQRRIGIAQALINDPEFLVLDEPTTGLDPLGTRQIKDLIIELGRRGKTVLLSSHLLADVEDCVDRLVILYGGQVRAEGTCESLLEAQERTTLEVDQLDEGTIGEIDRVIRSRSNGEKSIRRVARPRQTLEALFVDIVERAKKEQLATSGATSGGATASFLGGVAGGGAGAAGAGIAANEQLIDELVKASAAPAAPEPEVAAAAADATKPAGPDTGVIGDLLSGVQRDLGGEEPMVAGARGVGGAAGKAAKPQESVDSGVIDMLLEGGKDAGPGERSGDKPASKTGGGAGQS
jgi:ABC-2 type transport system ATP-binding protein